MDGVRQQRSETFPFNIFHDGIWFLRANMIDVCACVSVCASPCVTACAGSGPFCQEAMKWHLGGVGGQSALIPLPVSVCLLAARCWWLPRVSALDECPLEGKGFWNGKTQTPPSALKPPRCEITLHVRYETLSATAGGDKLNDVHVILSWNAGNLLQRGSSQRGQGCRKYKVH